MMRIVQGLVILLLVVQSQCSCAQYFHFTQFDFTPLRINPAQIALTRDASLGIISRNQSTGGDFQINSNLFTAIYPLLNSSTGRPWSGVALQLLDDRSGGIFSSQEISLGYALHVRPTNHSTLSLGITGLYQTRSISTAGLTTSWQYIPDRGFNEGLPNGESSDEFRQSYYTLNAGLYWARNDAAGEMLSYVGAALSHLTRPTELFISATQRISPTLTVVGGVVTYQSSTIRFIPEVMLLANSGLQVSVGSRTQYFLRPDKKSTPSHIDLLTRIIPGRSGILGVQVHKAALSFGVSYDFPLFFRNPSNQGALEVALVLRKPVLTRAEIIRERRKKIAEARQQARKTKTVPTKGAVVAKDSTKNPVPSDTTFAIAGDTLKANPLITLEPGPDSLTSQTRIGRITQEPYVVEKITLRFQFRYNSYELDENAQEFLSTLSKVLHDDPKLSLKIVGHTDNIGSEEFNRKLSLRRADAIRKALIQLGIQGERLQTDGAGMSDPIDSNETETGRSQNRRVELLLFRNLD